MGLFNRVFGKGGKESEANNASTKRVVAKKESAAKPNIDKAKEKKDIEGLIKALADADKGAKNYDEVVQKRERIVEDLAKIGKPAVDPLIQALGDKNGQVRSGAAWTLGKIKDRRAVEPLIRALGDKSNTVRTESAFALGEIGDKKAIKPLEAILLMSGSMAPGTLEEARKAINKIRKR